MLNLPRQNQTEETPYYQSRSGRHDFLSTLALLGGALLVAILIILFVFRSYEVDGPSMETTLQDNDKLIIWKLPRTWARVTGHDYIPQRGDIIVFNESGLSEYGQQNSKQLIKRVIGLPGERVTIKNGNYVVFNQAHPKGFNPDTGIQRNETNGLVNVTLNEDELFVSGDNRPESLDSRSFGPIKADQVVGKLVVRIFPLNHTKVF